MNNNKDNRLLKHHQHSNDESNDAGNLSYKRENRTVLFELSYEFSHCVCTPFPLKALMNKPGNLM